jgi:hypothetical protein
MATRSSKGEGKVVSFLIDVWYNEKERRIHIGSNDRDEALANFKVTVSADETKPDRHRTLFDRLTKLLKAHGAPAPGD